MVKYVNVICEDWTCQKECLGVDCSNHDPHEVKFVDLPKNVKALFECLDLVYKEDDR